jgi:hypothetical protein
MAVTLSNFGERCNRAAFQFPVGVGYMSDKSQENLASLLGKGWKTANNHQSFQSILSNSDRM